MDTPQKVAILSPHTPNIGEAAAIPRLARGLVQIGYSVDLLSAWREWDHLATEDLPTGMRVVSLKTSRFVPWIPNIRAISPWASYRLWAAMVSAGMAPGLIRYIQKQSPNFLISRMLTTPTALINTLSKANTKLILSMAGFPRDSAIRRFLWPRLYKYADALTSPSQELIDQAAKLSHLPKSKFKVIPNPIIDEEVIAQSKEKIVHSWFNNDEVPVIIAAGRLTRQKDFPTLIKAFAIALEQVSAKLVIIGDGEDRQRLEQLTLALGVGSKVDLARRKPNPYQYIRAANIFVLSSLWEGPGHALIEAVALGTPSITTRCPAGPVETVQNGKTGLIVPIGDPVAMADAIVDLVKNPAKAKKLAAAGAKTAERYTPESVAAQWDQLFKSL